MTVLKRGIPDHVPVSPNTSNMIPAKLTGKPYWDIYLYQDPPLWKAYIDCVKRFEFDSLMDGYVENEFDDLAMEERKFDRNAIVYRNDDRIVTQAYATANGKNFWSDSVTVYHRGNPPSVVSPSAIHLPAVPGSFAEVAGAREWPTGSELLSLAKKEMGEHGLAGVWCGTSKLVHTEQDIYDFFDEKEAFFEKRDALLGFFEKKFKRLMKPPRPTGFHLRRGIWDAGPPDSCHLQGAWASHSQADDEAGEGSGDSIPHPLLRP
jgi:hypothetical protein